MYRSILLAVMLLHCTLIQAQIYKWSDEQGKVHYSSIPPQTGRYEIIEKPPAPSQNPADVMQELQQKVEATDKAREEAQRREQDTKAAEDEAAKRTANCEQAKTNLQTLESGKLVFRVDAQGNRIRLEGEQREQALNQARKDIDYYCNP